MGVYSKCCGREVWEDGDRVCSRCVVDWVYEDELPEMTQVQFDLAYESSRVIGGVRMYKKDAITKALTARG